MTIPHVPVVEGVEIRDLGARVLGVAVLAAGECVRAGDVLGDLPLRQPPHVPGRVLPPPPVRVVRPARLGAPDGSATPTTIAAVDSDATKGEAQVQVITSGDFLADGVRLPAGLPLLAVASALRARGINLCRPPKA